MLRIGRRKVKKHKKPQEFCLDFYVLKVGFSAAGYRGVPLDLGSNVEAR
jgi:hypothetical protein